MTGLGLFELEAMSFPRHTLISAISSCLAPLVALTILSFLLLLEAVGWLLPGFRHTPMDRGLSWPRGPRVLHTAQLEQRGMW